MNKEITRKVTREYWGVESQPEVVELIGAGLKRQGFEFIGHDNGAPCSIWGKRLFDGYSADILIWPKKLEGERRRYSFVSTLAVMSTRQLEVARKLLVVDSKEREKGLCVLSISINWLLAATHIEQSFKSAFDRWSAERFDGPLRCSTDFVAVIERLCAGPFARLGSPEGLLEILRDWPRCIGDVTLSGGLTSAMPRAFSAVLLADMGKRSEALELLASGVAFDGWLENDQVTAAYKEFILRM